MGCHNCWWMAGGASCSIQGAFFSDEVGVEIGGYLDGAVLCNGTHHRFCARGLCAQLVVENSGVVYILKQKCCIYQGKETSSECDHPERMKSPRQSMISSINLLGGSTMLDCFKNSRFGSGFSSGL
jgi:hypothetical protein